MQNVLSVYNESTKQILQVRTNPIMTVGGLKQRIALKYSYNLTNPAVKPQDVIIYFNGVKYDSNPPKKRREPTDTSSIKLVRLTRKMPMKVSRTPSPSNARNRFRGPKRDIPHSGQSSEGEEIEVQLSSE
mmetsp:Transcript_13135/g.20418  ORF Transcript_13135/g.20418 Transcript_13135/m.20418 type:complete len:130 (-) Transcript_13135:453-842(-)